MVCMPGTFLLKLRTLLTHLKLSRSCRIFGNPESILVHNDEMHGSLTIGAHCDIGCTGDYMFYLYLHLETFDNPVGHQAIFFSYDTFFAVIHVSTPKYPGMWLPRESHKEVQRCIMLLITCILSMK
jgi:hypothetical protein